MVSNLLILYYQALSFSLSQRVAEGGGWVISREKARARARGVISLEFRSFNRQELGLAAWGNAAQSIRAYNSVALTRSQG